MIRIHIFTYKEDDQEAVAAARCARMACPSALVRVLDDCHAPVDAGTVEALEELGAVYDQTSWMRGGNLRGPGAIVGVLRSMAADASPDDILVKLDSDTALLDGDWLQWMATHPECLWYSSGDDRHLTYGCCYAVRAHVAVHLADILQARHLPDSAPEDLTYALTMIEEYGREACRIEAPWRRGETENSRWSCWCWHSAEASPDLYARMFRMVTTGNPRPHGVPRERRAEVMHSLCNAKIKLMAAAAIAPVQGTDQPSFR
ncbi:MAG: hypothetical protein K1W09_02560 [Akkermansia muciniphila]|uniref:hypothetical protein n=1 Tax=uncultured Akkermansia sp. TaxID=512294 RepID=UPI002622B996|nr:hypothetical protein [uncultured Akkermansia sp.]